MGLGINVPILLSQIVNFVVLFGILYLVAYRPVMRVLNKRSARIKESMEQAQTVEAQLASTEQEFKRRLEDANRQQEEIIAKAKQRSEEIIEEAIQEAGKEAEERLKKTRQEIQEERERAIDEMRGEIADLIVLASGKVIEQSLDKEAHLKLIDRILHKSIASKSG